MQTTAELRRALAESEERDTRQALIQTAGRPSKAAELLGVSKPTVYRRMKKYGIEIQRVVNQAA
jgi:transcriptional regulator of acetoin/glycerol metabolism